MYLILQIVGGILSSVFIMVWWHEVGAFTSAMLGSVFLLLLAASLTWGDLLALSVIAGLIAGAVWLGVRYEAVEWQEAEDEFAQ